MRPPLAILGGVLLVGPGSVAAAPALEPTPACGEPAAYEEIAVALGDGPCSTADPVERRRIHALAGTVTESGEAVRIDYPEDGSIFPPEIVPPRFTWHDPNDDADRWLVELRFGEPRGVLRVLVDGEPAPAGEIDPRCVSITNEIYAGTEEQRSARTWRPDPRLWDEIKKRSTAAPATVTVLGYREDRPDRALSKGSITFSTSRDPVGAPIFYRDVPLMPSQTKDGVIKPLDQSALPLIRWRLKDVAREDSRVLLKDMPTCANCHSFSADGKTLGMDVDGPDGDKGAYAVAAVGERVVIDNEQILTWNAFDGRPPGHLIFGFLSRVSPDGRRVVSTVNEALYVRNFPNHRFLQVFYPTRGILAAWSREDGTIESVPGADDPRFVQCNAVWTPDGKDLVFARAEARDPYDRTRPVATYADDPNETPMRYDLYRIPFNDGKGGTAKPIPGASGNGMSNSFPKVSPDGKWLVWVQSRNGMLMRPDGKLWIAPLDGSAAPRMMRCNKERMNSWHSFSPNGRWMVFSSKADTPYTRLYLTHIDEKGNDSPAILIEGTTVANRAANIPEFVNVRYGDFAAIDVPAVRHYRSVARGNELAREGRASEAVAEFEEALEGDPQDWRITDWRVHDSMSKMLLQLGQTDRAIEHIKASLRINPANAEMHANLGYILFERGRLQEAAHHLDVAVRLAPGEAQAWYNRATLRLTRGDLEGALEDYDHAVEARPDYVDALNGRAAARVLAGNGSGALADFGRAIDLRPDDPTAWYLRGRLHVEAGRLREGLADLDRARELCPRGSPRCAEIERVRRETLDRLERASPESPSGSGQES